MNNLNSYEKIMQLAGLEKIKEVISKWDSTIHSLKENDIDFSALLPHLFLVSKPGAGKDEFISLLSDYLEEIKYIDYFGDVKYFVFNLEYVSPKAELSELNRLIEQVKVYAGFRHEYRGVIAIDISEWGEHQNEEHFISILEYLSYISAKSFIIFCADNFTEEQAEKTERMINAFCRICAVEFPYPSHEELSEYCVQKLKKYKLILDEQAKLVLAESIKKLMESEYFYGYNTANRICLDIAFELSSYISDKDTVISQELLHTFTKDSAFIENLYSANKIRQIGF